MTKRVLLITSNFPRWPGDATTPFVLNLAVDLQKEGWQVDVLAPHAPGAKRRETMNGIDVRRFRYLLPESQQTVCYGGGALINLRERRSNWLKVPALVLAEMAVTTWRLLRGRYDIVNAHWLLPQGFVGAVAGRLTRTPMVATVHGGDVFDLRGSTLGRFKRWAIKRARVVTVNSTATAAATRAIEPTATIAKIPMGVESRAADAGQVDAIRHRHRVGAGPLVVFVGRLVAEKGVADLIEAMPVVRNAAPAAKLLVVGSGQDESAFVALSEDLGLGDSVVFTGWVDPAEVPAYMAAADVFAGPSKRSASGWEEGLGLVFLEAMMAGTPVVATRTGGIPVIVRNERTGLLVAEGSPDQLAAAILRLHTNPTLRSQLVAGGKDLVTGTYTRQASAAAFAELFDSLR
ncbi:MAG: glycosyltransferase [Acidimicrobiia bacterium]|nr:glycosyltransferase [Acidimicrobiia bacterium]